MSYLVVPRFFTKILGESTAVLASNLGPFKSGSGTCMVRWASKKAGSASRNRGGKAPGQRLGKKVREGDFVRANQVLIRQKFSFRWLPGQYVLAGYRRTLNAQVDGHIYYTKARWQPALEDDWSKNVAPTLPDSMMSKKFVNVRPAPQIGKFRLVQQI